MNLLRRTGKPAARHAYRAEVYRCVLVFTWAGKPDIQGGGPTSKHQAIQQWKHVVASGAYQPGSGRRALVMADADYQHLLGGA